MTNDNIEDCDDDHFQEKDKCVQVLRTFPVVDFVAIVQKSLDRVLLLLSSLLCCYCCDNRTRS